MAEINFPDPAVTNPWQDPVSLQWWQHDGAGWLRVGATEGPILTGYKNVLINGDFRINQRNFNGDWAALPNEYGYDRWAKSSLTEIIQHIEPGNVILGQTYTLSWEGGGFGSFSTDPQDSATESPFTGIASDNNLGPHTDAAVPFAATNVQLELGSVPTAFELRPIGLELMLCQRYYVSIPAAIRTYMPLTTGADTQRRATIPLPVPMRIEPIVTAVRQNQASGTFSSSTHNVDYDGVATGASSGINITSFIADAEF